MVLRVSMWVLCVLTAIGGMAFAQEYPNKPIRIVTVGVGGATDLTTRIVAPGIAAPLGQPVIVDNRAVNPAGIVAKAPPDGYTLLLAGSFALDALLRDMGYDPVKDFAPIASIAKSPNLIVINPTVPANSMKEFVALAKAKPGTLNYGSSGVGSVSYIGVELFKSVAGINIVNVPYKAVGEMLTDVISNQVQMTLIGLGGTMPHIKAGRLKALGITSLEPSALAPGVPTVASQGYPGFEVSIITGMYAPAKTPQAVITRLNREVTRFLSTPEVKQKFFDLTVDLAPSTPEQLETQLKQQMQQWGKVIKDAGIKAN